MPIHGALLRLRGLRVCRQERTRFRPPCLGFEADPYPVCLLRRGPAIPGRLCTAFGSVFKTESGEETMKIPAAISEVELENDRGITIPGVEACCSKCGHTTQSFGTELRSIRRCLVLMREECPFNERNFYTCDEDPRDDDE